MERNLVGITKKLGLLLIVVILVSLSLPVHIILANGTTVEVNRGNPITLGVGGSQSGIPLDIRGIVVSEGALGLAAFDFTLSWDADVIHVNSLVTTAAAMTRGFQPIIGAIDNVAGTVRLLGTTTKTPYSTADLTVVTLNISAAPGAMPGDSTSIDVTITDLVDNKLQQITLRTVVKAPLSIWMGELVSITVTPAAPLITMGETQQFIATGTYTLGTADITGLVTWASRNPSVATIDTAGLATSLAAGTTAITAILYAIDGTTALTVTEAETEEEEVVASSTEAEPGITDVSDSADDENGVFAEEATAESEDDKVELDIDEGSSTVKVPPPNPTSWWVWLIVGLAVVAVIGVVSWLVLRRRTV